MRSFKNPVLRYLLTTPNGLASSALLWSVFFLGLYIKSGFSGFMVTACVGSLCLAVASKYKKCR